MCRAWQLFDWVRTLPEGHGLQRLCDANTYSTMITLCGPWQQLRRALQLVAEMRNRSLECGIQVISTLNYHLACPSTAGWLAPCCSLTDTTEAWHYLHGYTCSLIPTQDAITAHCPLLTLLWQSQPDKIHGACLTGLLACVQAYSALLHAAVKCGESDLAVDVYGQMKGEGMPRDRSIHVAMIEMFVKLGRVSNALSALGELHAIGEPPDTPPLQPGPCSSDQAWPTPLRPHSVPQVCIFTF